MTLKAVLTNKAPGFVAVAPEMKISGVINTLADKRIGAVLVVTKAGELAGILSERDIVRSLASRAADTFTMTAAALMTPHPITAAPSTTVAQAMEIMTDGHFRHLPVVEDGRLIGVVSIGDVVKARIDQSEHEVESLRTYVAGQV
jgi:CBS domain-containing protein